MADSVLRVLITAVDRLSPVLLAQSRMIHGWSQSLSSVSSGAAMQAAGLGAALGVPVQAFMDAEDAALQLKNTLMTSDGLTPGFDQLSKIATELGNKLPGTTADFYNMASVMKALGVSTESLNSGALVAAAQLAVVAKPLGVTYEQAAESVGKLSSAFGIASQDLVPFADTVQRALHMGIKLDEFQLGMARIAGPLKAAGMQGLQVAKDMTPLLGLLIKAGVSGDEAGTGIRTMITEAIAENRFTGIKGLVKDLEQLNKLPLVEKMEKFGEVFGESHAGKASIVAAGGYGQMIKDMEKQADLNARIESSLGSLRNTWEALEGTVTNVMAAFASSYAPELKATAVALNNLSGSVFGWVDANKSMINKAVKVAAGFVGIKLAIMAIGMALSVVSRLLVATPFGLFINALALLVPLVVANWGAITAFVETAWAAAVKTVLEFVPNFVAGMALAGDAVVSAFTGMGDVIKSAFGGSIDWVAGQWQALIDSTSMGIEAMVSAFSQLGNVGVSAFGGSVEWVANQWQGLIDSTSMGIEAMVSAFSQLGNVGVSAFGGSVEWVANQWQWLLQTLQSAPAVVSAVAAAVGSAISGGIGAAVSWVIGKWQWLLQTLQSAPAVVSAVASAVGAAISGGIGAAVSWVIGKWQWLLQTLQSAPAVVSAVAAAVGAAISGSIGAAIDVVVGKWHGFVSTISGAMASISSFMSGVGKMQVGVTMPRVVGSKPIFNQAGGFKGSLDINHVGAPAGFRATAPKVRGPFKVNQNVGYNYSVTGAF